MAWDTINAILGLATVDPAFCHDLLENPLSAALAQHFDLTPEEQEVLKKIHAKDLAEFSQIVMQEFGRQK